MIKWLRTVLIAVLLVESNQQRANKESNQQAVRPGNVTQATRSGNNAQGPRPGDTVHSAKQGHKAKAPGYPTNTQCWTDWFDRDNPSGTGDWEILSALRKEYKEKTCKNPLQIEVQTTSGLSVASTGNVIAAADTTTGFICRNSDQKQGTCYDYRVRFMCPLDFCTQKECWTDWFDRDNPSGTGDWEILSALRGVYPGKICNKPLQIEVQTTSGLSVASTGNVIAAADTTTGFICRNSDQKQGTCYDYRVRFMCPLDFCTQKECWTDWFDRDNPSGTGDWEILSALRGVYPGKICNKPLQIEVQTTSGLSVASTGNVIAAADTTTGFICKNYDQKQGMCHDYRVRFMCPMDFCSQKVCWTKWFDRDNPSGTGDWELLHLLRKDDPRGICKSPLYIDVVTTDTNTPFTSTGQKALVYSPTGGFVCHNRDQKGRRCRDYKVRFGCPCRHNVIYQLTP